jgi:transcriptional regulator with XRE-family HTH domain
MNDELKSKGYAFGRHVRSLRRARGMTQEVLAEHSGLSPDTIRRLEHGSFSPSLETLNKLCTGLNLQLSTLFESYELGERNVLRELLDLVESRGARYVALATRMLQALFPELDGLVAEARREGVEAERADAEQRERLERLAGTEERDRRDRKRRQEAESRERRKQRDEEDPDDEDPDDEDGP